MTLEEFKEHICELGYEDAIVFDSPSYVDAYIGMSHDGRVIYEKFAKKPTTLVVG